MSQCDNINVPVVRSSTINECETAVFNVAQTD